jgi:trehalose 6-phosphate phosphatase
MQDMTENDNAAAAFAALDPSAIALLLDVDGTLIDIGPSPFEVDVPDSLKAALQGLLDKTRGALALVSGRPIRDLDMLFAPLRLPAVGGHGAEMRLHEGEPVARAPDLPDGLRRDLIAAVVPGAGVEYEDKGYSVALHFRKAPQEEARLRAHVRETVAAYPDENTEALPGKAMIEVKRTGVSKGVAVRRLMRQPPFAGRKPVFIGDDVTDESVFAVMPALGGVNFSVGREFPGVSHVFAAPKDVRRALADIAGTHA